MLGYWAMRKVIHKTYVRAGVTVPGSEAGETMPWHSLRHTFGMSWPRAGSPPQIQRLTGHADIKTTMRYVTTTDDQLDAAIGLAFGQQVGNRPSENATASDSPSKM